MKDYIIINPLDNVAVCLREHKAGEIVEGVTLLSPIQPFQYPWIQTTINGEKLGTSVLIDRESVAKIMDDLSILGITEDKIMGEPDYNYDKVCKEIVNSLKHTK